MNLVPANGRWCSAAGKVTAGLAESNESNDLEVISLYVTLM